MKNEQNSNTKKSSGTKCNNQRNRNRGGASQNRQSNNRDGFAQLRFADEKPSCPKESFNDVSWYAGSPRLLKDAASLNFSEVQGLPYDIGIPKYWTTKGGGDAAIPGILMFDVSLIPGLSTSQYSAVTTAAYQVYTTVRKANSGKTNYDAVDLMMYLLAVDNALAFHSFIRRVYDIAKTYSSTNRYTPRALIEGMYIDFDDVVENMATLRYLLNDYASKLNSLPAPGYMPIFARHKWMFQNVYKDSESSKSQFYCFCPEGFYSYSPTASAEGTSLVFNSWKPSGSSKYKVTGADTTIRSWFETLMNPIFGDTDTGTMGGDIRKAFDASLLIHVDEVEVDEAIEPVYNYEVISQINNLVTVGNFKSDNAIVQKQPEPNQGNPYIYFNPKTVIPNNIVLPDDYKLFLNSYHDNPLPEDVMVSTRLSAFLSYNVPTKDNLIITAGTELVHRMRQLQLSYSPSGAKLESTVIHTHHLCLANGEENNPLFATGDFTPYFALAMFDRHPLVYSCIGTFKNGAWDNTATELLSLVGDLDNYTVLSDSDLIKMNNIAVQSEFGIYSM